MKSEEKKRLIALYEDRYEQYGYDVRTIGWGNKESQILRFDVLCDISDLRGRSVCDLGCGFGDLYPYLLKRFGDVEYFGIDISPKLIGKAKEKYPDASFAVFDILEYDISRKFDFILSSGALKPGANLKALEKYSIAFTLYISLLVASKLVTKIAPKLLNM